MSDKNEWSTIDAIKEISPDWQEKTLNCFSTMKRNSFVNGPFGSDLLSSDMQLDGGVPVVYIRDICDGRYIRKSEVFVTFEKAEKLSACKTEYGDILISKVGDPPCEAAIYTGTENAIVTQDVIRVSTGSRALSEFLTYVLNSDIGKRQVKRIKITGTRERVSLTDFKKLKFLSPPLPEQIKIAEILSTWDNAINTVQKLLANSQQQKKALMQQLLTGKKRFSGFEEEWKWIRVSDLLEVRKERQIPTDDIPLFSLTIENGVTPKSDRYNREFLVKNSDEKKYKVVHPKDIVYNPANLRWGAINFSRVNHAVVVSPIYEVLYIRDKACVSLEFVAQKLMTPDQINRFAAMVEGTLVERMAVKIEPFLATKLSIPPSIEEQKKIATLLTTADQEIDNLRAQLNHLKQEKKALMQQLLTGKRRVKVEEAA